MKILSLIISLLLLTTSQAFAKTKLSCVAAFYPSGTSGLNQILRGEKEVTTNANHETARLELSLNKQYLISAELLRYESQDKFVVHVTHGAGESIEKGITPFTQVSWVVYDNRQPMQIDVLGYKKTGQKLIAKDEQFNRTFEVDGMKIVCRVSE
jgi:hypothetical protein